MPYVLQRFSVAKWDDLRSIYTDHGEARRRAGSKGGRVLRSASDPHQFIVMLEWDDADKAREFYESPAVRQAVEFATGDVSPQFEVYELLLESEA